MPKFRDLGINAIPLTMRPPEVGYGAAGKDTPDTQCQDPSTCGPYGGPDTQCQNPSTCGAMGPDTQCQQHRTCQPDVTQCRGQATCKPDDDLGTACGAEAPTCFAYRPGSALTPDAVAQLRQQLDSHIDSKLKQ